MALATVFWNTFFIFHFSRLSLLPFVQNSFSLVSFFGGRWECIIVKKKWFQNSTHLLFWRYMYFCNVLKNQYKKANTSINVAIALWLKPTCIPALFNHQSNLRPSAALGLLQRRAEKWRQRSSQGVGAAPFSQWRYGEASTAAGLQRDTDVNSQTSTLSWVNADKIYVKKKKKMQSVTFTPLYVCVGFFVKWAHSIWMGVGGRGGQTASSPTQKLTIIKHLMIMKKWHSRQLQDVMYATMASHACTITLMLSALKQSGMNAGNLSGAPHLILPSGHVDYGTRGSRPPLCHI